MIDWALYYLRRGWSVVPLCWPEFGAGHDAAACGCQRGCEGRDVGKRPLVPWKEFQERRPTEDEITEWWETWPSANLGVITGRVSGVVVLDYDGQAGAELLAKEPPPTEIVSATGDGAHVWHGRPPEAEKLRNAAGMVEGLDARADGGYVVAPPSMHLTGRRYAWPAAGPPTELPVLPAWAVEALTPRQNGVAPPVASVDAEEALLSAHGILPSQGTRYGQRREGLPKGHAYALKALDNEVAELAGWPRGGRNDKLAKATYALAGLLHVGAFSWTELRAALYDACERNGLVTEDGSKKQWDTIDHQMREGSAAPREIPEADIELPADKTSTTGYAQHLATDLVRTGGADEQARRPAIEIIRDFALDELEGVDGLGLVWREGSKAYAAKPGRLYERVSFGDLRRPALMQILLEQATELRYAHRIKQDAKLEAAVVHVYTQKARAAFQDVLDGLPERQEMPDCETRASSASLGSDTWRALTRSIMVSSDGADRPHLTTILKEVIRSRAASWSPVGERRIYVRDGNRLAACYDALIDLSMEIRDSMPRKALAKALAAQGIAQSSMIRVGGMLVRTYVFSREWILDQAGIESDDHQPKQTETETQQEDQK